MSSALPAKQRLGLPGGHDTPSLTWHMTFATNHPRFALPRRFLDREISSRGRAARARQGGPRRQTHVTERGPSTLVSEAEVPTTQRHRDSGEVDVIKVRAGSKQARAPRECRSSSGQGTGPKWAFGERALNKLLKPQAWFSSPGSE